jgi:2-iminobutanoate/2-iminopropanoate deaminase
MERTASHTDDAPKALGPYSQAILANGFVFCAGQTPVDPATGKLVEGDVSVQTRRCLDNLAAVLASAGSGWEHAVKVSVFLKDLGDFAAMNAVYGEYMPTPAPVRSTVEVAGLPLGARVEIDVVAVVA